jgi:hypothetical protein
MAGNKISLLDAAMTNPGARTAKHVGTGVALVTAGAYAYGLLYSVLLSRAAPKFNAGWFAAIVDPLKSILPCAWFLLPIGAVLGWLMPRLFLDREPRRAFARGVLLGLAVGLIVASLDARHDQLSLLLQGNQIGGTEVHLRRFKSLLLEVLPVMVPFCITGITIWAIRLSRMSKHERVA